MRIKLIISSILVVWLFFFILNVYVENFNDIFVFVCKNDFEWVLKK